MNDFLVFCFSIEGEVSKKACSGYDFSKETELELISKS